MLEAHPAVGAVAPLVSAAGGIDCDAIKKFKVKCRRGKLKVNIKSSLPQDTKLTVDNNGDQKVVKLNKKGKGKAKWTKQTGPHTVVIVECPEYSKEVDCG